MQVNVTRRIVDPTDPLGFRVNTGGGGDCARCGALLRPRERATEKRHLLEAAVSEKIEIKISDSVTQGVSYFYAEVQRLKALLVALERDDALPLFFCIDEIFRGTNNRERLIGSRAYIYALVNKQGVGLISTHDLELVKLADEMPVITNYHFRDDLVAGAMTFDYLLHPGPCPTTNALKVMRNAGLPVSIQEQP